MRENAIYLATNDNTFLLGLIDEIRQAPVPLCSVGFLFPKMLQVSRDLHDLELVLPRDLGDGHRIVEKQIDEVFAEHGAFKSATSPTEVR